MSHTHNEVAALAGIRVVDVAGTVSTGFAGKLFADYGAQVINVEPAEGFATRHLPPFVPGVASVDASALHAWLSTNKHSVLAGPGATELIAGADLLLDDGTEVTAPNGFDGVRASIRWFGRGGPYPEAAGGEAQMFALNGMLRTIGPVQGPPIIPTGYQAQVIGGITAFIGAMTHLLARDLDNYAGNGPVELETSIFEACLCFTEVGVVGYHNTGLQAPRMGVNRYPPTYPLGVFACRDGWLGVTVLTPSQWHTFCSLLGLDGLADVPLFQSSVGRLESIDVLEPLICEKLLEWSAEELFYRAQTSAVPLARVPTMEELFQVDQFLERRAFSSATLPGGAQLTVPSVAFRLFATPPRFGGPVAALGEHSALHT